MTSFNINLLQWLDRIELRLSAGKCPVFHQFSSVHRGPFGDKSKSARRKISTQDRESLNRNKSSLLRIPDMEMRRIVIGVVHLHNNTEETADLRHSDSFPTVTDLTESALCGELREF